MTLIPWGEWRPDVSDYNGQHTLRAENVFPRGDGYGPVPSLSGFTQALPATCRGAFIAFKSDGTIRIFAGTSTKLYVMSNTDGSWTDATRAVGGNYTLGSTANWQFAQLGDVVLATQGNDNLQSYTMGSSTQFADCAGTPPQAAYITIINQFVVLSGLTANPLRIAWSARGDSTGWTAGTNESDVNNFNYGGVVRGVAGGEQAGFVFFDNAISEMIYQPGSSVIFSFSRIAEGKGLRNPYSLVKAGDRVFFRSAAGFEMIVPGSVPVPIGKERFDRTFSADVDTGNLQLFIGAYEPNSSRVYWAYKSNTGAAGLFNRIIVWDFVLERAALITGISGEYIAQLGQPGLTLEALDAIQANLDAWTASFDSIAASSGVQLALFDSTHTGGFLSGNNLEATVDTAEFGDMNQRTFIRGFRPYTDNASTAGSLVTRNRLIDTASSSAEQTINSVGYFPFRQDNRYVKYRTRYPASTAWSFTIGVEPDLVQTGEK